MVTESFRKYLEEAIGSGNALVAFSAFDSPASVAVRKNPFKDGTCPEGREVPWCRHGRILPERPQFTLDPHFHAGAYYVQDSSSMFVGHAFRELLGSMDVHVGRPVRVLDLCAAPGGKTTDIAASLREAFGDGFLLVSNEVMKARAGVLADNVALWGDPNVVVTSDDPSAFAALPGFFDIIVADVPCSGEGMFRKDEEAQRQWSEDNVALCEARQRRIVADVWPSLAQNGLFIYSTCTFNRMENDGNVRFYIGQGYDPDSAILVSFLNQSRIACICYRIDFRILGMVWNCNDLYRAVRVRFVIKGDSFHVTCQSDGIVFLDCRIPFRRVSPFVYFHSGNVSTAVIDGYVIRGYAASVQQDRVCVYCKRFSINDYVYLYC